MTTSNPISDNSAEYKPQQPVVFEKADIRALSIPQVVIRKGVYVANMISFSLSAISGFNNNNLWRVASSGGSAAINAIAKGVKEGNAPLPDGGLPYQIATGLVSPKNNTLFFTKSWSQVLNIVQAISGALSERPEECGRGLHAAGIVGIELSALSDQDERMKAHKAGLVFSDPQIKTVGVGVQKADGTWVGASISLMKSLMKNRWFALSNVALRAASVVVEGVRHNDSWTFWGGVIFCFSCLAQFADHAISENRISQHTKER